VAFESFRAQDLARPRRQRRVAFTLVAIFHGVLIAAGVVYSYWHVEELTPPSLRVTFMTMAPPPPPPPPPPAGGGGARPKKVAVKKITEPVPEKPPEIVQPPEKKKINKEFRKHTDEYEEKDDSKVATGTGVGKGKIGDEDGDEDGEEGGVKGGVKGGSIGGTIGGTGTTPAPPRSMPAIWGDSHLEFGPMPKFPPTLIRGEREYLVGVDICVSATGSVDTVTVTKRADSLLDETVVKTVKTWRYRPLKFNGSNVGSCFPKQFLFKPEK
jgi:protein TonB